VRERARGGMRGVESESDKERERVLVSALSYLHSL